MKNYLPVVLNSNTVKDVTVFKVTPPPCNPPPRACRCNGNYPLTGGPAAGHAFLFLPAIFCTPKPVRGCFRIKYLLAAIFFCAFTFLSAQERSDIRLYVARTEGGSPEAREFFDTNIPAEIYGANYTVSDSLEGADYVVLMHITEEDSDPPFLFSLVISRPGETGTLVEFSWGYTEVEEMYEWNLYLLYQALANIPMTRAGERTAQASAAAAAAAAAPDGSSQRERRFFIGLRAAVAFPRYFFQVAPGYEPGIGAGLSGEAGLVTELRLFRFLSIQAEGDFLYESFDVPGAESSADIFTSMSFIFPLVVKVPLRFGRFTLSLYAGAYYALALWDMQKKPGGSGEAETAPLRMELPLGLIAGTDVGFLAGPGELFADFRYGRDLGGISIEGGPLYIKDRISVGIGYKFGF